MENVIFSFLGEGDGIFQVLWFLMFFGFMFLYPRLMITQTVWKLEKDAANLELLAKRTENIVVKKVSKKPSKEVKKKISDFMDFFAVSPIGMDPYGIMKKLDHTIKQSDNRFKLFVNEISPRASAIDKASIKNALAGAMTTHQIAKVVRHFLEIIKKYKILQLAILLQMQLPLIQNMAKSAAKATQAFVEVLPIGDGIGPLVTVSMVPKGKKMKIYKDEEFAVYQTKIRGRQVLLSKANGPGPSTGKPGKFLNKIIKRHKIKKIITVDAALRLEGEKAGSVAEGVGVAMGGPGVERYLIEQFATAKNIPLDAVVIKVNEEEALSPMILDVLKAVPKAQKAVKKSISHSKKSDKILIIGVGNTSGVGNSLKEAEISEDKIIKHAKRMKKIKAKKKKGKFFKF